MPKGRPENPDRPIAWEVQIPTSVAAKIELALFDPITERVKYGARSELVTQLLINWLEERAKEVQDEQRNTTVEATVGGTAHGPASKD